MESLPMECNYLKKKGQSPRIGEDYQADDIPILLKKSDYRILTDVETHLLNIDIGLSLPLMSIKHKDTPTESSANVISTSLGYDFMPGCPGQSWSFVDMARFRVGLYLFSKDFVLLKKFLENKRMEDILLVYYGFFYKSDDYNRWSESRKMKTEGVLGENLLLGIRHKVFMSRILPTMSKKPKNARLKVCEDFEEDKIAFEEFIFFIKNKIGISALVEAIGIGKGAQDLTTMALKPSRTNQWTSKTFDEIVRSLNKDKRLTKSRSNGLFWGAVWPRLVARGWHSVGPKGEVYDSTGGKKNLIFLVPGITNFCRRTLTEGIDYFDSVSVVLNKVASDPTLMKLKNNEEEDMELSVVDTTTGDGKHYNVRELSGLSFDLSQKVNSIRFHEAYTNESESSVQNNLYVMNPVQGMHPCPDSESVPVNENTEDLDISRANKRRRLTDDDVTKVDGQEIAGSMMIKPENVTNCSPVNDTADKREPRVKILFDLNLNPECEDEDEEHNVEHDEMAQSLVNDVGNKPIETIIIHDSDS